MRFTLATCPTVSSSAPMALEETAAMSGPPPALRRAAKLDTGVRVGDYVIDSLCAHGGFGTVYRAHHVYSGQEVALKVLHNDLAVSPAMVCRFEFEAATLNRIRHPNIVEVCEVGELDDGRPFFTMEWLEGQTLADELVMRGPFSLAEAVPVIEELCAALQAAHDVGIVHRDLKPTNVMLVPEGRTFAVKLFDFGIAKLLEPDDDCPGSMTSSGNRLGTPHYMAPEQLRRHPIDCRADVYALGVMLYHLLSGRLPFEARSPIEIADMHLRTPPPRVSDVAPVPPAVDAIIARCMAKDPDLRYDSPTAVIAALRSAARNPLRPRTRAAQTGTRVRARSAPGIGIHLEVSCGCDDDTIDDEILDGLEEMTAECRRWLESHGLAIVEEDMSTLLGVAVLPSGPRAAVRARKRIVESALRWSYTLRDGRDASSHVRVCISIHAGELIAAQVGADVEYVGGSLLHLDTWTSAEPEEGVTVTAAALDGMEDIVTLDRVAGGLYRESAVGMYQ